ncbi:MAG: phosphopantothenoylcysteine decarboxylase [Planctomycetota bacterium]
MKILITTGPTWEFIDPVRFITSGSTGTLGVVIAKQFLKDKKNKVSIISGPVNVKFPQRCSVYKVVTAHEMYKCIKKIYKRYDVIIMSASVSDFKPLKYFKSKIKRENKKSITIKLVRNPDILSFVSKNKKTHQILVGFSLESHDLLTNTLKKYCNKKVDLIVANTVPAFGNAKINGYFIYDNTIMQFKNLSKLAVAKKIKETVYQIFNLKRLGKR